MTRLTWRKKRGAGYGSPDSHDLHSGDEVLATVYEHSSSITPKIRGFYYVVPQSDELGISFINTASCTPFESIVDAKVEAKRYVVDHLKAAKELSRDEP